MTTTGEPSREVLPIPHRPDLTPPPLDARDAAFAPLRPLRPPAGAPNVLVIVIDDMGFGASSTFGGPCRMPASERLAERGLRYSRFHTTALCSPSRQALLTGRNHHSVNMGGITEVATSVPGYTSVRPDSAATIAQVLRLNGYHTAAFGKMHQTPVWEVSAAGPFDRWPTGEGFERFYGFVGAEANQWAPSLYEGTTPIPTPERPGYHLSEDITDQAIADVRQQRAVAPDRPFFGYLAFGATHAPHHAPAEWIERYRGAFDEGWDVHRARTLQRQKALGLVPPDGELTRRHPEIPAWDDLDDDRRRVGARLMEAYAGFAEHTDAQIGRMLDALDELGVADDTLVMLLLGDNGASAEGGAAGDLNEMIHQNGMQDTTEHILENLDAIGGPYAYNHYPAGWAHAMNTPYQWSKMIASHWGGTRNGLVVSWPGGIRARGEVRPQWCHCIDVVPTILEAAGLPAPVSVNGAAQQPIEGTSFAYSFDAPDAPDRHTVQYFEIGGNRGIYADGWSACTKHSMPWPVPNEQLPAFADDTWELYGPDDWSQAHDLAAHEPAKLAELKQRFVVEAARHSVFPLDDRKYERLNADLAGRPDPLAGRTSMTFVPGMTHLSENTVPNVKNKSFTVTARLAIPAGGADGAVIAQGGRFGGWTLYLLGGAPVYCHNFVGLERYVVQAAEPLAPGARTLGFHFAYDGGGVGRGGTGTLSVDGVEVASGRIERTVPIIYSYDDFMDIGQDSGAPVVADYPTPQGRFTGEIVSVLLEVGSDGHRDPEAEMRAARARQ